MSPAAEQPAPPRAPIPGDRLTEAIDNRSGIIDARGRLTPLGAELLAGTVRHLRRAGLQQVTVDLEQVQIVDPAALVLLTDLQQRIAARGGELLLRHRPTPDR